MKKEIAELAKILEGDVQTDSVSRMLYATDASLYQVQPAAVLRPRHRDDCRQLVQFAADEGLSLIPRGGGTSLAGQVVGTGVVVDCSRYMTQILEINVARRTARVEPGVIIDDLNEQLKSHGLKFAPEPSTSSRCVVAGVIGNNAWGVHCPIVGSTRNNVQALEVVLASGDLLRCEAMSVDRFQRLRNEATREGLLVQGLAEIIDRYRTPLMDRFGARDAVVNNMGYSLHEIARMEPWQAGGSPFNLAALFCGSEGTLGLITEATLKLVPIPRFRYLIAAHFDSLRAALEAVAPAVAAGAAAVELVDAYILELVQHNLEQRRNGYWIEGKPAAVLLIEFQGDVESIARERAGQLVEELRKMKLGYQWPVLTGNDLQAAWTVRRSGLGLLMGVPGPEKVATFIEDSAVPVAHLPEFVAGVQQVMNEYGVRCVYYGSVSMGLVHLRPFLDLHHPESKAKLLAIAGAVAKLIAGYKGSMSSKHGDGRVRSPWLPLLLGDDLVAAMAAVKHLFDPNDRFNPGKIVDPLPLDQDWRIRADVLPRASGPTYFLWPEAGGIRGAVERCHGAGACRRRKGPGTMCPSYRATFEESASTRGRANVFRQLFSSASFANALAHPQLHEVLDHCLGCKGCRAECPANVDMARLKAEHLQHYHDRNGLGMRGYFVKYLDALSRVAAAVPGLSNAVASAPTFKQWLGFHQDRSLPTYHSSTWRHWWKIRPRRKDGQPVLVMCDLFTEYFDVSAGQAVVEVLEHLGYVPQLTPRLPSLRTVISQGLLREARQRLRYTMDQLDLAAAATVPIVGVEPSETLTWRDEAPFLAENETQRRRAEAISDRLVLFDEFVASHWPEKADEALVESLPTVKEIVVHGHCHQKALLGMEPTIAALAKIPGSVPRVLATGCCGMAGLFGYEREHYELSRQIGESGVGAALTNLPADTLVVATGTSCRHQIRDLTGKRAYHPAEVLRMALKMGRAG